MRVAYIGDSHGQVLGPLLNAAVPLAVNVARPGWSEAKFLSAGAADLARLRGADLVVYQLGGNNFDTSPTSYAATLKRLLVAAGGARVVWIGPSTSTDPKVSARHEATAALQSRILPGLGVTWYDSRGVTRTGHRADGVHFTDYKPWARAVVSAVQAAPANFVSTSRVWWIAGALLFAGTLGAIRRVRMGR